MVSNVLAERIGVVLLFAENRSIAGHDFRGSCASLFADACLRETRDEQDGGIGMVGYEINFNGVFFQYQPPRPLQDIDAELADVEKRILELLREVTQ